MELFHPTCYVLHKDKSDNKSFKVHCKWELLVLGNVSIKSYSCEDWNVQLVINPTTCRFFNSQAYRVCDWWSNVDCPTSEQLYSNNEELYRDAEGNLIWGAASREVGGDEEGPEVISTLTRTPLEQPLAKLIDQHLERGGHQGAHTNHIHVGDNRVHQEGRKGSKSSEISGGRMRFPINKEEVERVPFWTLVHKNIVQKGGQTKEEGEDETTTTTTEKATVKLLSSNEINNINLSNYSALTGNRTNPKEAAGHDRSKPKTTKKKVFRGSKRFRFNAHDKNEVEYTTTTKRSTSFANKYNIDYDHLLEDEYEIIQKVE